MATLNYTAAQIDALLAKADTSVQPATTGDLDNLATSTKTDLVSAINETFTSVSDGKTLVAAAITDKGVATAATDSFSTMATNIAAIPSGGTAEAVEKDVNFIDYDGTILYSYSKAEFANLSAMPDNPSHDGLTAQGWNWTLSDAKTYVASYGKLWIGQTYVTTSGKTEIDVQLVQGRLAPYLGLGINGTVTIDWGDNSSADTVTGTSLTTQKRTQHTYSAPGIYTIKITATSGSFALLGSSTYSALSKGSSTANENRVYSSSVLSVRCGTNVKIGDYAFYYAYSLKSVVLPNSQAIGRNAFSDCENLTSIIIPGSTTIGGQNLFYNCYSLQAVSFPNNLANSNTQTFSNCLALRETPLFTSGTTLPNSTFSGCFSLTKAVIPVNITSLGTSVFSNCYGLGEIHFKPTTPPALTNVNTFNNLPTDCKIYVPTGKLNDYKTASYYPNPSTYTYVEE